ncbi:head-tail connector protein [Ligilactobacillus agilis]|uniref:head-tail connector protein n=1 Tax=Ligilactobacillus agilis TaxID=1601 RepID=UPI001956A0C2|nr:head-tail connector protein [Ligilactobacillus agilis]MBM6763674.1 phage gp6-like head-tail connector protein [Ligilactobacillus agilis]
MVTVEDLKNSLRIDNVEDDKLIQTFINSAESYIKSAVGKQADGLESDDRYTVAVIFLAGMYYENRAETEVKIPYQIRSIIGQLQAEYQ